jgi:hypothetical protein
LSLEYTNSSPMRPSATRNSGAGGRTSPVVVAIDGQSLNALKPTLDVIGKITYVDRDDAKMSSRSPTTTGGERDCGRVRKFQCGTCPKAFTKPEHLHVRNYISINSALTC